MRDEEAVAKGAGKAETVEQKSVTKTQSRLSIPNTKKLSDSLANNAKDSKAKNAAKSKSDGTSESSAAVTE